LLHFVFVYLPSQKPEIVKDYSDYCKAKNSYRPTVYKKLGIAKATNRQCIVMTTNKGRFDHSRHSAPGCVDCHAAPDSDKATDVLLPQIATCQACHGGETAAQRVPSTCVACHDFHLDFHQPMRPIVQNAHAEGG